MMILAMAMSTKKQPLCEVKPERTGQPLAGSGSDGPDELAMLVKAFPTTKGPNDRRKEYSVFLLEQVP
jgi:hypothetical protein